MLRIITLISLLSLVISCTKDVTSEDVKIDANLKRMISNVSPTGNYEFYKVPHNTELDQIPQDIRNPLTPEKVELGKMLFFETGLAMDARHSVGMGTYSCASCHLPEAGFRPGAPQGVADGGMGYGFNGETRIKSNVYREDELDSQNARPLSLINVAYVTNTFWNGQFGGKHANEHTEEVWDQLEETELNHLGYEGIETQNIEGVKVHRITTNKELLDQYGYTNLYDEVFADMEPELRYSDLATSLALSAYIRSITSYEAPFQEWLRGNSEALTAQEKLGVEVFFGKARCTNCHYEKNLGSVEFHRLGVKDLYQRPSFNTFADARRNFGRGGFTLDPEDNYKFKVPQLYNLADAPFYFHGSSKHTLAEVVDYKIEAISENPNVPTEILSDKFGPLDLTEEERDGLIAFLTNGLRDPDLLRYKPTAVLSGLCFPNNDEQSRIDLGCY